MRWIVFFLLVLCCQPHAQEDPFGIRNLKPLSEPDLVNGESAKKVVSADTYEWDPGGFKSIDKFCVSVVVNNDLKSVSDYDLISTIKILAELRLRTCGIPVIEELGTDSSYRQSEAQIELEMTIIGVENYCIYHISVFSYQLVSIVPEQSKSHGYIFYASPWNSGYTGTCSAEDTMSILKERTEDLINALINDYLKANPK